MDKMPGRPAAQPGIPQSEPEEYLMSAYILGAEAAMEIIRQRAIANGHSGTGKASVAD
jgi:hypothetical protein